MRRDGVQLKRLILAIALLCSPCWATWSVVQVKDSTSCSGTSACAVTVTSTTAHNALFAAIINGTNITISSVAAGACNVAWVHGSGTNLFVSADGAVDMYYCTDAVGGLTSVSITPSGTWNLPIALIAEASSTLGNIAINSGATPSGSTNDSTSCSTTCPGTSLTLSTNNSVIFSIASCGSSCNGVTGTNCVNQLANPSGDGVETIVNNAATSNPCGYKQSSSSTMVNAAIALQETSGGGPTATGVNKKQKLDLLETAPR